MIFFLEHSKVELIFEIFCDLVFLLDFISGFFTAYYDFEENLILSLDKIIVNYLENLFLLDLIDMIPFNSIYEINAYVLDLGKKLCDN